MTLKLHPAPCKHPYQSSNFLPFYLKKMRFPKALALFATIFVLFANQMVKANAWDEANRAIQRLDPKEFRTLPSNILEKLTTQGCTIPQSFENNSPHNVINGEFGNTGQKDWAVLCSRKDSSAILIFWGGQASCPSEFLQSPDRSWLQHTGEGISYSRVITAVGPKFMLKQLDAYEGSTPPPITHQGINQSFVGKGSSVWYCFQGKWLELTGAD